MKCVLVGAVAALIFGGGTAMAAAGNCRQVESFLLQMDTNKYKHGVDTATQLTFGFNASEMTDSDARAAIEVVVNCVETSPTGEFYHLQAGSPDFVRRYLDERMASLMRDGRYEYQEALKFLMDLELTIPDASTQSLDDAVGVSSRAKEQLALIEALYESNPTDRAKEMRAYIDKILDAGRASEDRKVALDAERKENEARQAELRRQAAEERARQDALDAERRLEQAQADEVSRGIMRDAELIKEKAEAEMKAIQDREQAKLNEIAAAEKRLKIAQSLLGAAYTQILAAEHCSEIGVGFTAQELSQFKAYLKRESEKLNLSEDDKAEIWNAIVLAAGPTISTLGRQECADHRTELFMIFPDFFRNLKGSSAAPF